MVAFGRLAGGLLLAIVAVLWLSVMTWSVSDPSLTHATSGTPRNLMGALGAIVSDLLLQTLGLATLIVLVAPLFWGIAMLKSRSSNVGLSKSQFFWFPVAAIVTAGAFSSLPAVASWPLHHGLGGIVGDTVFAASAKIFALINASRAGIAAGLVLIVASGIAFSRAIAISFADMLGSVLPGKAAAGTQAYEPLHGETAAHGMSGDRFEQSAPFVDSSGRIEPNLMVPPDLSIPERGARGPAPHGYPQHNAHGNQSLGNRLAHAFGRARDAAQRGVAAANERASRLTANLQDAAAVRRAGGQGGADRAMASHPHGAHPGGHDVGYANRPQHMPASMGAGRPATYHHGAPAPGQTHGWPPQSSGASAYGTPYEPYEDGDFDVTTEDSSRAMAERFAPQRTEAIDQDWQGATMMPPRMAPPVQPPMPQPQNGSRSAMPGGVRAECAHGGPVRAARPAPGPHPADPAAVAQPHASAPVKRNALLGGLKFRSQNPVAAAKHPPLNLLKKQVASKAGPEFTQTMLRGNARLLEDVLADFGVKGEIRDIRPGPVVTLFEFEPARGVKSSRVIGLADDIARSMSATSARVAVVPGRNAIGIELPNSRRDPVLLREVLESESYKSVDSALPIALGKSIGGEPVVTDLARMPHLLVAGTTGSGKSVGVNAMILSLLYRMSPDECRFLMIDPKMLELSVYNGIPHLLAPVVTDPQKAVTALNWVVGEMEERYKRMAKLSVRNIDVYNNRVRNAKKRGEMISRTVQTGFDRRTGEAVYEQEQMELETMPFIVVVIDEFADLMMVAGKEVEASVQRLAQMARAAGIHIIMATQRPSVDVITGTIKANFPTRISFKVTSKIDSRTILNEQGAEQLLGQGDMLFAAGSGQIARVHGAFVADEEVEAITDFLRSQGAPRYVDGITDTPEEGGAERPLPQGQGDEDLYDRAVAIIVRDRKASTSYLQRRLSIGYNRAADLIERMEAEGLIGPANHAGKREILAQPGDNPADPTADAA